MNADCKTRDGLTPPMIFNDSERSGFHRFSKYLRKDFCIDALSTSADPAELNNATKMPNICVRNTPEPVASDSEHLQ
ncbi:hypothetical protein DPMN_112324 [Dreissena polymorpha]|uniref:Uncharacterized protein n=1 Tax=Dreissena polymorpha TaxID=45954 RepID=A0A9D4QQJ4_DREPO|nr:hypothetical protein DPMN_112324 [Dreissena polymorpha]